MNFRVILLFLLFNVFASVLFGQIEAHYWTHQYGAKGLLLNGAVIASADDETTIFYNPGSIGLDNNLGFAFSFLSPNYSSLTLNNFFGDDNKITDTGLDFSPGFLALRFKPFKTSKIVAGVAGFKRFKSDIKFRDRVVDVVDDSEFGLFRGDLDFKRRVSEDWFGLGISYNVFPKFGIGVSQFAVFHSQELDFNFKKEIFESDVVDNPLLSWRSEFGYNLSSYGGFITKLGMAYKSHYFSFGLTYTSQLYNKVRLNGSYFSDDLQIDNIDSQVSASSNRREVNVEAYETPSSVGFGLDFLIGKTRSSISAEYFRNIEKYTIFEDADDGFNGLSENPQIEEISLQSENDAVLNVALGIQHIVSRKTTWLLGFRTDFDQGNSLLINNNAEYLGSTGDIFHVSGGGMFRFGKNLFSLGVDFGIGENRGGQQLVDLTDVTQENIFSFSGKDNVTSRFYSMMVFITYDFIFNITDR